MACFFGSFQHLIIIRPDLHRNFIVYMALSDMSSHLIRHNASNIIGFCFIW